MPPKASADAKKASKGKAKTSAKGKGTLSTGDDSAHGGSELKAAIKVVVTGGAGQIAYSLLPILVSGSEPASGRIEDDGTVFNPGVGGPTRVAPLRGGHGSAVPTMYLGASRRRSGASTG